MTYYVRILGEGGTLEDWSFDANSVREAKGTARTALKRKGYRVDSVCSVDLPDPAPRVIRAWNLGRRAFCDVAVLAVDP